MKHLNVFPLQRADNLGLSGKGCEISQDLQLLAQEEEVVSEASEDPVIQQQEPQQILGELTILWTLL